MKELRWANLKDIHLVVQMVLHWAVCWGRRLALRLVVQRDGLRASHLEDQKVVHSADEKVGWTVLLKADMLDQKWVEKLVANSVGQWAD